MAGLLTDLQAADVRVYSMNSKAYFLGILPNMSEKGVFSPLGSS